MHLTRWQRFYAEDARIATTPPSACARSAVEAFRRHGARTVLDLGCGPAYTFRGIRCFPSYLQAGPSFFIEKSKRRMIAEDIGAALALLR